MQNEPNFVNTEFNLSSFVTSEYETLSRWKGQKTNPIQTQFNPIQTQNKPNFGTISGVAKPKQTQSSTAWEPFINLIISALLIKSVCFACFKQRRIRIETT
jgi:hypothetical protein